MHIGLIGGIGVAATVVYYQRLTDACRARSTTSPDITITHADVQELIRNNESGAATAQAEIYVKHLERLKAAGADCAAITSLGGQFCFNETAAISPLPLVSGVAPLDDYFALRGFETVGLLGTRVVMRTHLYGQLSKVSAIAPEALDEVGQAYVDMAVDGDCSDELSAYFIAQGQKLIDRGADAVVLAGTDLNLAFDGVDTGYEVIDALDVHVDVLADLATDRRSLTEIGVK